MNYAHTSPHIFSCQHRAGRSLSMSQESVSKRTALENNCMYVLGKLTKFGAINLGFCVFLAITSTVSATITHCPTNRVISANADCAAILPDLTVELESSDGGVPTQEPIPGTTLVLGTTQVTFTLIDTNGVTNTCSADVTVVDDTPPVFVVCATNRALPAGANCLLTLPDFTGELTVTDSCSAVTVTQNPAPG